MTDVGLYEGGSASGGFATRGSRCGGWVDPQDPSGIMGYGQQAGGTHLRGIHSSVSFIHDILNTNDIYVEHRFLGNLHWREGNLIQV